MISEILIDDSIYIDKKEFDKLTKYVPEISNRLTPTSQIFFAGEYEMICYFNDYIKKRIGETITEETAKDIIDRAYEIFIDDIEFETRKIK